MTKPAFVLLAAAATCAAFTPGLAAAQSPIETTVAYADLDLQQQDQVAELDRRLDLAVATLCGERAAPDFQGFHDWNKCRNEARNTAAEGRAFALGEAAQRQRRVNIEQSRR